MDARDRAKRLAAMVHAASGKHYRPYSTTMSIVDHAIGGAEPLLVVADRDRLPFEGRAVSGELLVVTERVIAIVHLKLAAPASGSPVEHDDGPISVDVLPIEDLLSVRFECPGVARTGVAAAIAEDPFGAVPWGTKLMLTLRGRPSPLEVSGDTPGSDLVEVQRRLLRIRGWADGEEVRDA